MIKVLKISRIFILVIICLYLVCCFAGSYLLRFSNLSFYVIQSGSMQPEINIDDVVVAQKLDETEVYSVLKEGDIATYFDGSAYVTHRVYEKTVNENGENVFIFKGDNNNTIDRYSVKPEQIRGKQIFIIPDGEWIFEFLNSIYGIDSCSAALIYD